MLIVFFGCSSVILLFWVDGMYFGFFSCFFDVFKGGRLDICWIFLCFDVGVVLFVGDFVDWVRGEWFLSLVKVVLFKDF